MHYFWLLKVVKRLKGSSMTSYCQAAFWHLNVPGPVGSYRVTDLAMLLAMADAPPKRHNVFAKPKWGWHVVILVQLYMLKYWGFGRASEALSESGGIGQFYRFVLSPPSLLLWSKNDKRKAFRRLQTVEIVPQVFFGAVFHTNCPFYLSSTHLFGVYPNISTSHWHRIPSYLIFEGEKAPFYNSLICNAKVSGPPAQLGFRVLRYVYSQSVCRACCLWRPIGVTCTTTKVLSLLILKVFRTYLLV